MRARAAELPGFPLRPGPIPLIFRAAPADMTIVHECVGQIGPNYHRAQTRGTTPGVPSGPGAVWAWPGTELGPEGTDLSGRRARKAPRSVVRAANLAAGKPVDSGANP